MGRESAADRLSRAREIAKRLGRMYPGATTALNFQTPLQLLVATVLSAQCTDQRVNQVTAGLFKKYRSAEAFAQADPDELMADIRSTGFFRNKARSIQAACRDLLARHRGQVPDTMEELTALAGVGRKTANVVLGNAFGKAAGVAVDTHVARLSQRLGLSGQKSPEKIERDLMALIDKKDWIFLSHALILHGRTTCVARRPNCAACKLADRCPSAFSFPHNRKGG